MSSIVTQCGGAATFVLVDFAWIFFLMPTLADACGVIGHIFFNPHEPLAVKVTANHVFLLMALGSVHLFAKDLRTNASRTTSVVRQREPGREVEIPYVAVASLILVAGVFDSNQFIYANF